MITGEASTKFHDSWGKGSLLGRCHINHVVKLHYFFTNLPQGQIKRNKGKVMMPKEGSIKIVRSMTPRAGIFVLEHSHISYIVKIIALVIIYLKIIFSSLRHK